MCYRIQIPCLKAFTNSRGPKRDEKHLTVRTLRAWIPLRLFGRVSQKAPPDTLRAMRRDHTKPRQFNHLPAANLWCPQSNFHSQKSAIVFSSSLNPSTTKLSSSRCPLPFQPSIPQSAFQKKHRENTSLCKVQNKHFAHSLFFKTFLVNA